MSIELDMYQAFAVDRILARRLRRPAPAFR